MISGVAAIGIRIKKRRQVLGMTQEALAGRLGVSKSTVANWERGKHFPLRHLGAVEAALDISLGDEPPPGPLAGLQATDEWEASVLDDPYLPAEDKRWLIEQSREARRAYVAARRERRQAEDRSDRGRAAG